MSETMITGRHYQDFIPDILTCQKSWTVGTLVKQIKLASNIHSSIKLGTNLGKDAIAYRISSVQKGDNILLYTPQYEAFFWSDKASWTQGTKFFPLTPPVSGIEVGDYLTFDGVSKVKTAFESHDKQASKDVLSCEIMNNLMCDALKYATDNNKIEKTEDHDSLLIELATLFNFSRNADIFADALKEYKGRKRSKISLVATSPTIPLKQLKSQTKLFKTLIKWVESILRKETTTVSFIGINDQKGFIIFERENKKIKKDGKTMWKTTIVSITFRMVDKNEKSDMKDFIPSTPKKKDKDKDWIVNILQKYVKYIFPVQAMPFLYDPAAATPIEFGNTTRAYRSQAIDFSYQSEDSKFVKNVNLVKFLDWFSPFELTADAKRVKISSSELSTIDKIKKFGNAKDQQNKSLEMLAFFKLEFGGKLFRHILNVSGATIELVTTQSVPNALWSWLSPLKSGKQKHSDAVENLLKDLNICVKISNNDEKKNADSSQSEKTIPTILHDSDLKENRETNRINLVKNFYNAYVEFYLEFNRLMGVKVKDHPIFELKTNGDGTKTFGKLDSELKQYDGLKEELKDSPLSSLNVRVAGKRAISYGTGDKLVETGPFQLVFFLSTDSFKSHVNRHGLFISQQTGATRAPLLRLGSAGHSVHHVQESLNSLTHVEKRAVNTLFSQRLTAQVKSLDKSVQDKLKAERANFHLFPGTTLDVNDGVGKIQRVTVWLYPPFSTVVFVINDRWKLSDGTLEVKLVSLTDIVDMNHIHNSPISYLQHATLKMREAFGDGLIKEWWSDATMFNLDQTLVEAWKMDIAPKTTDHALMYLFQYLCVYLRSVEETMKKESQERVKDLSAAVRTTDVSLTSKEAASSYRGKKKRKKKKKF